MAFLTKSNFFIINLTEVTNKLANLRRYENLYYTSLIHFTKFFNTF